MQRILVALCLALAFSFSFATLVFAVPPPNPLPEGPQTGQALLDMIKLIADWIFAIFLVVAVIYILLAALQFVTSGGDPMAVTQARQKIIYAAVGIAIALLAKGIPFAIKNILS